MSEYNLRKEDISQVLGNQTYKVPSLGLVTSEFERIDLILKSYLDEESERKTAEANRVTAEKLRALAENGRVEAEKERSSAEDKRALAEQERNKNVSDALLSINDSQGNNIVGVRQVQESQEDNGRNILQIDFKNGQHASFNVYNGSKGSKGDKGDKGDKGERGEKGDKGDKGADGGFADLGDINVSVDATIGTPSASVSNVLGSDGKSQLTFKFSGIKGEKGDKGEKGADGKNGAKGEKGEKGDMGSISNVGVSVDATVGTPNATATVSKNQDGSTNIDFSFTGLKGEKGEKGEAGTGTNVTKKVSKARTRIVCRKAIRLGATKANGNLVKYFTHFPTLSLKCDQKYIVYLNDVLVDVKALYSNPLCKSVYLCHKENLSFSESGVISYAKGGSYQTDAKTFAVPLSVHTSKGYLYWVDRVTLLDIGVYEVRVSSKAVPGFSYNTENVYLTISNGKLVSKVTNVGNVIFNKGRVRWDVSETGKNFDFKSYLKIRVRKRRSKINSDKAGRKTNWFKYKMFSGLSPKASGKTGLWKHYLYYKGILISESRFVLSRINDANDNLIYNIMKV